MATFTISIPKELKQEMDKYKEINWVEFIKKVFETKLMELKKFDELRSNGGI